MLTILNVIFVFSHANAAVGETFPNHFTAPGSRTTPKIRLCKQNAQRKASRHRGPLFLISRLFSYKIQLLGLNSSSIPLSSLASHSVLLGLNLGMFVSITVRDGNDKEFNDTTSELDS